MTEIWQCTKCRRRKRIWRKWYSDIVDRMYRCRTCGRKTCYIRMEIEGI